MLITLKCKKKFPFTLFLFLLFILQKEKSKFSIFYFGKKNLLLIVLKLILHVS